MFAVLGGWRRYVLHFCAGISWWSNQPLLTLPAVPTMILHSAENMVKKREKSKQSPPSKEIKYQCKIWFRFVHSTLIKIPFQKNIYNWRFLTLKLSSSVGVSTQRNALTLPFSDAIMSVMAPLLISDYVLICDTGGAVYLLYSLTHFGSHINVYRIGKV